MTRCATDALGRSGCAEFLRTQFQGIGDRAGHGCEVTVSTAPPLVQSVYGEHCYTCPHGTVYWVEPTTDQTMQWVANEVP